MELPGFSSLEPLHIFSLDELDVAHARRPGEEIKRINVDFPAWMVAALDREARRLGVTRQSIIKMWLAEHLQQE
jgi:hypothetical protein